MVLSYEIITELAKLQTEISNVTKTHTVTENQVENFLMKLEIRRMNILNEIKLYNSKMTDENNKIFDIDENYKAYKEKDFLKIVIPEVMPKYKNITRATHKRITNNVADITKNFSNMFKDIVLVYIKLFDSQKKWDIDNKTVKPILDGLVLSNVIQDDDFNSTFICVQGISSENPHTEVVVMSGKIMSDMLESYI